MKEGWDKVTLGQIARYSTPKIDAVELNAYNFISADNMEVDRGGITTSVYAPTKGRATLFEEEDVLVSNIRPYFKKIWQAKFRGGCSNDVFVLRAKKHKVDPVFLYYYLSKQDFFDYMMAGANGTKMPRGNKKAIPKYKINLPPLPTQRKIASILSAYDDLIENNLIRIRLCCELADTKFNSLFFQHDDWQTIPLYEYADYLGRGVTPKYEDGTGFYGINQKANKGLTLNKQVFKEYEIGNWVPLEKYAYQGDVLINSLGEGTIGRVHYYVGEEGTYPVDQHMTILRAKEKPFGLFIYQFFNSEFGQAHLHTLKKGGTNMTMLNVGDIRKIKLKVPNQTVINEFYKAIQPLYDLKSKLEVQNENLKEARDILLPRLMTEMIDVDQIQSENLQPTTA